MTGAVPGAVAFLLSLALFSTTLVFLALATRTDVRNRIVPNKLTHAAMALGVLLNAVLSLATGNYAFIAHSLVVGGATFALAYGLWKLGAWAGGDVKLFTAIGFLSPANPAVLFHAGILSNPLFAPSSLPVFPLSLFIASVLALVPLALAKSFQALARKKGKKAAITRIASASLLQSTIWGAFLAALGGLLLTTGFSPLLGIPLAFIFGVLPKRVQWALALGLFLASQTLSTATLANALVFSASIFMITLLAAGYARAKKALVHEKPITLLAEGEIIGETIVATPGGAARIPPLSLAQMLRLAAQGKTRELAQRIAPPQRIIASHRAARGLDPDEIKELVQLVKNKKLENHILVKESVPFVPAVLVAFVALALAGDVLWNVVL